MKKIISLILIAAFVLTLALTLVSCDTIDSYKDRLEEADYEVEVSDDEDEIEAWAESADVDADDIKSILVAANEDFESVTIIECKSSSAANDLYDSLEDDIKDIEEAYELIGKTFVAEVKGSFFIFGDEAAVEDAIG